jgi:hypothetical protein
MSSNTSPSEVANTLAQAFFGALGARSRSNGAVGPRRRGVRRKIELICIAPIRSAVSYAIALHEVGHYAAFRIMPRRCGFA